MNTLENKLTNLSLNNSSNRNSSEFNNNSGLNLEINAYITLSQRQAPQLYHDGHYYRQNGVPDTQGHYNWRCVVPNCKVTCATNGNQIGSEYKLIRINDHKHVEPARPQKLPNLECRRELKTKAVVSEDDPRKLITKTKSASKMTDCELFNFRIQQNHIH
jgi:hypothetical protein